MSRPSGSGGMVLIVVVSCCSSPPVHVASPVNEVFPNEHPFLMYLPNARNEVVVELFLRGRENSLVDLFDREVDVSLYRLDRMRHEPAFATKLIAHCCDVGLKKVNLRWELSAYSSNQMIYTPGVVGGVPAR